MKHFGNLWGNPAGFIGQNYSDIAKKSVNYIKVTGESFSDSLKYKKDTYGDLTCETK